MIGIVTAIHNRFVKQLDGSPLGGVNCTMASGAMAAFRHTLGKKRLSGASLRRLSGDRSGGTNLDQLRAALGRAGVPGFSQVYRGMAILALYAYLRSGRGAVVQGSAVATRGTRWQASESFVGNHAWYVSHGLNFDSRGRPAYLVVYDPLADGRRRGIAKSPLRIPRNIFEKFLANLDFGHERLGYGFAYALFTKVTNPHRHATHGGVYVRARITVKPGYWIRQGPGGKKLRKTRAGEVFDVWQRLSTGPLVGSSRVWFADHSGTRWIHASARKK